MAVLIFFVAHHYLSLFSQTFFQHRYGAHGAFSMSKGWERFWFIFTWVTEGSSYLSPRTYALMHRMHHAYADTDKDPHSPLHYKNVFAMMWATKTTYTDIFDNKFPIEERFTKNLPNWDKFDRFAHGWAPRLFWAGAYTTFYIFFATQWWMFLLLPIHFTMGPIHGAIINWYAHKYGYKNFKLKSTAVNLLPVDVIMLGESYHNNHHKRASHPNFGIRKHEIDPVYPFIRLFNAIGIIKLKKLPTEFIETDF